jgi:hypothetical protein
MFVSCEISSSHGGEYEAQNLLGCTSVFLIEYRLTFQRYVLPPSSGRLLCCVLCVVLSCTVRGLYDRLITRPEESYRVSNCV